MTPETFFDPQLGEVVLVHFFVEDGIACMPGLRQFSADPLGRAAPMMRSDERSAVSCPMCKRTEIYRRPR